LTLYSVQPRARLTGLASTSAGASSMHPDPPPTHRRPRHRPMEASEAAEPQRPAARGTTGVRAGSGTTARASHGTLVPMSSDGESPHYSERLRVPFGWWLAGGVLTLAI